MKVNRKIKNALKYKYEVLEAEKEVLQARNGVLNEIHCFMKKKS